MESSGLRGWIRLVIVALTNEKSSQTVPRGPETDQNRLKKSKNGPQTRKTTRSYQLCWVYCSTDQG